MRGSGITAPEQAHRTLAPPCQVMMGHPRPLPARSPGPRGRRSRRRSCLEPPSYAAVERGPVASGSLALLARSRPAVTVQCRRPCTGPKARPRSRGSISALSGTATSVGWTVPQPSTYARSEGGVTALRGNRRTPRWLMGDPAVHGVLLQLSAIWAVPQSPRRMRGVGFAPCHSGVVRELPPRGVPPVGRSRRGVSPGVRHRRTAVVRAVPPGPYGATREPHRPSALETVPPGGPHSQMPPGRARLPRRARRRRECVPRGAVPRVPPPREHIPIYGRGVHKSMGRRTPRPPGIRRYP